MATLLAFAALPACATSNVPPTSSSSTGSAAGGGDAGGGGSMTTGTGGEASVCGDGDIAATESCDDGNLVDGDGCGAKCEFETGWECAGAPSVCKATCGDGLLVGAEACDDGNTAKADGCSDSCTVDNGYTCTGAPSVCATVCGDGVLVGAEECDDKGVLAGDGCSADCKVEKGWACIAQPSKCTTSCGDGLLAGAEVCDDGNLMPGDGCDDSCGVEPFYTCTGEPSACVTPCGDAHVVGTELCDDANTIDGDGCNSACKPEPGYACTGEPSVCEVICGDGIQSGLEACDDGNTANGDGCNAACKVEPGFNCSGATPTVCSTVCGDGYAAGTETCDVGPAKPNDGCDDSCHAEHGYTCNNIPSVCATVCGDGLIGGAEQCDDGNSVSGDGCSATCAKEPGAACAGEPSVCITTCGDGIVAGTEKCDDGNLVNGDCCSSTCGFEAGCEIEPNDSIGTANDFVALAISGTVKGTIKPSNDHDTYLITLPAGQTSVLTAATVDGFNSSCANLTEDSFLSVFDVDNNPLASADGGGPGKCAQVQAIGLPGGDYFVQVQAGTSTQFSYGLAIQVQKVVCGDGITMPGEQCDDGNTADGDGCSSVCVIEVASEIEPNGSTALALVNGAFPVGELWAGAITPIGDNDFYLVHLSAAADLRTETFDDVYATTCASIDTKIYLYAADGTTELDVDDDSGIGSCSLMDSAVSAGSRHLLPGDYYLRVQRYNDGDVIPAYWLRMTYNALCGNGIVEGGEQCDGGGGCAANCEVTPVCGDGLLGGSEQCEDGNTASGDGCSSTCQLEPGYECTTTLPTVCTAILNCPAPGQVLVFNGTGLPAPIDDLQTTASTVNVAATGNVVQAILKVNLLHTWDDDLEITLSSPMSPAGVTVSSSHGGNGDNYTNTIFSDSCPTPIATGDAPFLGCFMPDSPLSALAGQPAAGDWTLGVFDGSGGDTGTLLSWQLTVCVQ